MKNLQILDIDLTESIDSASLKFTSLTAQELERIIGGECIIHEGIICCKR
jgi:hypothetical protein